MVKRRLQSVIVISSLFIYSFFGILTNAQLVPNTGTQFNEVSLTLTPEYPKPGDVVQAHIVSYSQELQGLDIKWFLDDELISQGQGNVKIELNAPQLGEQSELTVRVGEVAQTSLTLSPIYIDLLYEADTYVPNWYNGRALPVDSSHIKASAIPHGITQDAGTLLYNWYTDGRFLQSISGAGKSTITIDSPGLFDDYNLSVQILNKKGNKLGESGVHIYSTEPEVILYKITPLLGILTNSALSKNIMSNNVESGIIALPYFFTATSPLDLNYKWDINNIKHTKPTPNTLVLIKSLTNSNISLEVYNQSILLQSAHTTYRTPATSNKQQDTNNQNTDSPFGNPNQ